jgi:hypothetical protein
MVGVSLPIRLLRLMGEDSILSLAELARRLDSTPDLVRMIAEDLTRRDYLQPLSLDCAACDGCALSGACGAPAPAAPRAPLWRLTPRGQRAAGIL